MATKSPEVGSMFSLFLICLDYAPCGGKRKKTRQKGRPRNHQAVFRIPHSNPCRHKSLTPCPPPHSLLWVLAPATVRLPSSLSYANTSLWTLRQLRMLYRLNATYIILTNSLCPANTPFCPTHEPIRRLLNSQQWCDTCSDSTVAPAQHP